AHGMLTALLPSLTLHAGLPPSRAERFPRAAWCAIREYRAAVRARADYAEVWDSVRRARQLGCALHPGFLGGARTEDAGGTQTVKTDQTGANASRLIIFICLILTLVTLAAYWRVLGHDFVDYDD